MAEFRLIDSRVEGRQVPLYDQLAVQGIDELAITDSFELLT